MDQTVDSQLAQAESRVKTLLNTELKAFCREEGLPVTGVKAILQERVMQRLRDCAESGDLTRFHELRQKLGLGISLNIAPQSTDAHYPNYGTMPSWAVSQPQRSYSSYTPSLASNHAQRRLIFAESPFYSVLESLTGNIDLPVMSSKRHTINAIVNLKPFVVDQLKSSSAYRILVYCSGDSDRYSRKVNVSFPTQMEIRMNNEAFTGNTRGIKKKPGTTRPADITPFVKRVANFPNNFSVTYAATDRSFTLVICLARKHRVEELVDRVRKGHVITKQKVVEEMISKAKDPDVVTTSTVMSLKCPLSTMRMALPCRSTSCSHNQCFDATSFLQIQEQAPQWSCPICNKTFPFEALVVDQYVENILRHVSSSVDQVTIEPDGTWKAGSKSDDSLIASHEKQKARHDDQLVEISASRSINGHNNMTVTPISYAKTPTTSSREPSAASAISSSSKRKAPEVIDLTLSSDEERPLKFSIKRLSTASQPSFHLNEASLPTPSYSSGWSQAVHSPTKPNGPTTFDLSGWG